ncbi:MAG: GLPGLI family protein [Bacteroidales bacterium]|nr:GLPGLI family protein [Bacteroidales bacterium]
MTSNRNNFTKTIFLLFASLSLTLTGYSQFDDSYTDLDKTEYLVTYSMKFQEDSLNPHYISQEDMLLLIGPKMSKFLSYNYYIGDSLVRTISTHEEFQELVNHPQNIMPRVRLMYEIFKNYPIGKITTTDHIIGDPFKYEEKMDQFHWELRSDTATLHGFKVQQAICFFGGRQWIAWYTADIPISDGPYKFNGLPGLILNLSDSKQHYVFEFVSISKIAYALMIDMNDKEYIRSSKQEFFKARNNFREDIISRAREAGAGVQTQQVAAQNMARRNNPIELE